MKKISLPLLLVSLSSLILSGCGSLSPDQKEDFIIQTKAFGDFGKEVFITRPGRIAGSSEIAVTSQVNGRVSALSKKDGQSVTGWEPVITIKDSVANYGLQVQKAKNALDRSILQYDQTKISLNKNFLDAQNAVDAAENTYNVSQKVTEQTLRKANLDYQNADNSTENLQLQLGVEKTNLLNLLDVILHQVDTVMWTTPEYATYNDDYEVYLWAKNPTQKTTVETAVTDLYALREKIRNINENQPTPAQIQDGVTLLDSGYKKAKFVLDGMKTVFLNTIVSVNLSQTMINGYKSSMDGLNSSLQLADTAFVAYRKQIISLLANGGSGAIVEVGNENADISYQTTLVNTQNTLFNTELGLKTAKSNYDTIVQNKDVQLALVQNSIADANVAYQDILTKFNKLSVRASISGVIWSVLVDVGQEVAPGTPLFTLISSDNQLVEVFVSAEESKYLQLDQYAKVDYAGESYTGTVMSISSVADKNTLYKVVVGLDRPVDLIGDVVNVSFPLRVSTPVLPINAITPISQYTGSIWILYGTGLQKIDVQIWRVRDDYVQIQSPLAPNLTVVLNDVSNFDEEKFVLKKE